MRSLHLVAALCLGASLLSPQSAASADDTTLPVIMSGTVLDALGAPLAGATVIASVEKYEELQNRTKDSVIATAVSDGSGNFELNDILSEPSTQNPDGSVVMQITTMTDDAVWHRIVNIAPPANELSDWSWASQEAIDPGLLPTTDISKDVEGAPVVGVVLAAAGAENMSMTASTEMVAPFSSQETDLTDDEKLDLQMDSLAAQTGTTAALDAAYAQKYKQCASGGGDLYWQGTSTYKDRKIPVGWDAVQNKQRMAFSWSTAKKTTMSVAYAGEGTNYAGGLAYSESREDNTGVGWKRNDTNAVHQYRIEWRYQKQREFCYNMGYSYETGKVRYFPWYTTYGNAMDQNGTTRFTCDPDWRIQNTAKIWTSQNTAETWSGWFSIAGVALNAVQKTVGQAQFTFESSDGTNVQRWFELRNAYSTGLICGKGGLPTNVPFVEEVS